MQWEVLWWTVTCEFWGSSDLQWGLNSTVVKTTQTEEMEKARGKEQVGRSPHK